MNSTSRLNALDGWRGLGTCMIIANHCYLIFLKEGPGLKFISNYAIVSQFFCVSGFLVFKSLSERFEKESLPYRNFYIRRFFRIVPLWWTVLFAQHFLLSPLSAKVLLTNMFLFFGLFSYDLTYLPIYPAWSLFVEEIFYLIMPLMFISLRSPARVLVYFYCAFVLAHLAVDIGPTIGIPSENNFIPQSVFTNIQYFFLGIATYHLWKSAPAMKVVESLRSYGILDFLFVTAMVVPNFITIPYQPILLALLIPALVSGTLISRWLNFSVLKWIGVRCYGMYLVHTLVSQKLIPIVNFHSPADLGPAAKGTILYLSTLAITLVIAGVSFRWFEKPMMKFGEKLIHRNQAIGPVTSPTS